MTLILELPDAKESILKTKAQAQGISAEQFAEQVLDRALEEGGPAPPTLRPHISEIICARMRKIPTEAWAELPSNGASEHDHYIYGLPKRNS